MFVCHVFILHDNLLDEVFKATKVNRENCTNLPQFAMQFAMSSQFFNLVNVPY